MPDKISIIVPVLNEAAEIGPCLEHLQAFRNNGHEVIVVDGGSRDRTRELALPLCDRLVQQLRGRARQMNAGAGLANGNILLFLHVDTRLPDNAENRIIAAVSQSRGWGHFSVKLSGRHVLFRIIEAMMNLRTRLTHVVTGDHAVFCFRGLFEQVNGYDDIPLMEDIALSKKLRRCQKPAILKERVTTSSRRWEERGIINTVLTMWYLRLRYFLGGDTTGLARIYE